MKIFYNENLKVCKENEAFYIAENSQNATIVMDHDEISISEFLIESTAFRVVKADDDGRVILVVMSNNHVSSASFESDLAAAIAEELR